MKKTHNCMLIVLALLALGITAQAQDVTRAQDQPIRESLRATGPAVTISVTERGVRFAALGSFGKMRLEVFNADGSSLYNSDFAAASVRDWVLDNKDGQLLPDGTYLCVITIRDLSGRMSTKQGSVVLQSGQPSLKLTEGESVQVVEQDKSLARVTDPPNNALTLVGHDGENGQLVNTRGALTFRFGDFFSGKDKEQMRLTQEGNLGIGTAKPEFKLDVAGAIRARQGFVFNDGSSLNVNDKGALTLTSSNGNGAVTLTNGSGTITSSVAGTGTQNYLAKWAETGGTGTLQNSGIFETAGGNVGIGTMSPFANLEIQGANTVTDSNGNLRIVTTTAQGADIGGQITWGGKITDAGAIYSIASMAGRKENSTSGNFASYLAYGTTPSGGGLTERLRITSTGNVGIGTASPLFHLHTFGTSGNPSLSAAAGIASIRGSSTTQLTFGSYSGTPFGLWLQTNDSSYGGSAYPLILNPLGGNVGIGTNNPQSPLDVNGNLNVTGNATISGNIAAKYQDIAEWTSARTKLPSGTVVSLDTFKPNSVMASNKAYDTRVAGVVSAQPGVILGEGGPNRVLVATTGRVKIRVNANRYPIHIGDLLVSSDSPGVAMKSQQFRVHGRVMHQH